MRNVSQNSRTIPPASRRRLALPTPAWSIRKGGRLLRPPADRTRSWSIPMSIGLLAICGALAVLLAGLPAGAAEAARSVEAGRIEALVPQWEVGDGWVVETVSRPLHVRAEAASARYTSALRWQFRVLPSSGALSDCVCVEARCEGAAEGRAKTVFWLDRQSHALRQITTYLPVAGGFEEMTTSYDSPSGQPAPILGPLSALPIDTPVLYAGTKGLQTFSYTSYPGARERKELGDMGFAYQVEQAVSELPQDEVARLLGQHFAKSLLDDPLTKSLTAEPVTEVRLSSLGRQVRQLWQSNRPWPIYCDNGYTVSRLVSVERKEGRP